MLKHSRTFLNVLEASRISSNSVEDSEIFWNILEDSGVWAPWWLDRTLLSRIYKPINSMLRPYYVKDQQKALIGELAYYS